MSFHIADYVVFAVVLAISLAIGIFFGTREQKTPGDYLLGGRKMNIVPVAISLVITFVSPITMLGMSAEVYFYGVQYLLFPVCMIVGALVAASTFVPMLYPLKLTSSNQYLRLRFDSHAVTYLGTIIQLLNLIVAGGFFLVGPAILFLSVSGCPLWGSLILMTGVATIYSTLGGFKAVIWTDVFQASIILIGILAVLIQATVLTGGPLRVWEFYDAGGRVFFETTPSPFKRGDVLSLPILQGILATIMYGVLQMAVQRYSAVPSLGKAIGVVLMVTPGIILFYGISCLCGVVAFAYYAAKGCDPYRSGIIRNSNEILFQLVQDTLDYPGVPGIFIAAIWCGTLSNLSSTLSSLAAFTWDDLLKRFFMNATDRKQTIVTRVLVFIYGILSLVVALGCLQMEGTLIQMTMTVMSVIMLPLGLVFVIGGLFPRANWLNAIICCLVILGLNVWVVVGNNLFMKQTALLPTDTSNCNLTSPGSDVTVQPDTIRFALLNESLNSLEVPYSFSNGTSVEEESSGLMKLYSISFFWYGAFDFAIGLTLSLILCIIPGLRNAPGSVDKKYLFPFVRCCYRQRHGSYELAEKITHSTLEKQPPEKHEKKYHSKYKPLKGSPSKTSAESPQPDEHRDEENNIPDEIIYIMPEKKVVRKNAKRDTPAQKPKKEKKRKEDAKNKEETEYVLTSV